MSRISDRQGRESIARRGACPARAALLALCVGCAAPRAARETAPAFAADPAADAAIAAGALVVQLAFDARADLDLYVTDPFEETVYFANTPSRSGGALDRDRGCGDPAPRMETVVFAAPAPGRYRIGVDHPQSCDGNGDAPFAVRASHHDQRSERRGAIEPRHFAPIVLEIELP